ncbi:hypothetical protein NLX86_18460 [Streptomyces sp. A3M-1-3]|uniref:hypothetical protein n=1 Tax=Streptomyces sp. A3M-1-3 TaxID=2962044 RepID=UPI0020B81A4C|nr:hypothetical protein [Streptomyces sp. A3M-1-3]MCP3820003.1 hypothetical protein [Streptomyces sp. A3M-1-3]
MRRDDMREPGDTGGLPGDGGLTTENLAHPQEGVEEDRDIRDEDAALPGEPEPATAEGESAVYPGEATADLGERDEQAGALDTAGQERAAEAQADEQADQQADQQEAAAAQAEQGDQDESLLSAEDATGYRNAWGEIQGRFVDDPRDAVRSADALVAEVMQTLAQSFSSHKQGLEGQWDRGEEVPTEDLRLALQRYRSFFNRLLST